MAQKRLDKLRLIVHWAGKRLFCLTCWGRLGQVDWGVSVCRAAGFLVLFSYQGQEMREPRERPLLWTQKKRGCPRLIALLFGD